MTRERVLITGGGSGIGRTIANQCQSVGYEPVVIDRVGGDIQADLSSMKETAVAIEQALTSGPIHRLVNNVGIVLPGSLDDTSVDELNLAFELNVRCAVQCAQALIPGMRERNFGRIVNMASRVILGKADRTAYAASKAANIGMTRTWALELGPSGVTVNAIAPGPIATELFMNANSDEQRARIAASVPLGRVGQPDDIGKAAGFLLSEDSGFITGQTLFVCGGMSIQQAGF